MGAKYTIDVFQAALKETEAIRIYRRPNYPELEYDEEGGYTPGSVDAYKAMVEAETPPICVATSMEDAQLVVAALNAFGK